MIEHLVVSTIVLAVAMALARALPLTARTRHAVLVAGLAKFAIPTAMFTAAGVATIDLPAPLVLDGRGVTAAVPQSSVNWLLVVWATVATLLFGRWLLLRTRTISAALRSPSEASPREVAALREARRILSLRTPVDVVRSPLCEAPAVVRIVRPVVLLPSNGPELTDDELRALLLHELAHVARRDNLVSTFTALAASLLWFHPLVWLAMRQLNQAREQACDEVAIEHGPSFLDAMTKVCRSMLAPRTAGASCMAGNHVKERMNHLMRYQTLKARAWSHRAVLGATLLLIAAAACMSSPAPEPQPVVAKSEGFSGAPITINLKDADVRDVMRMFGNITGMEIEVSPDVTGKVSMEVKDMPWDEALLKAAYQVGAKAVIDGKTIRISK